MYISITAAVDDIILLFHSQSLTPSLLIYSPSLINSSISLYLPPFLRPLIHSTYLHFFRLPFIFSPPSTKLPSLFLSFSLLFFVFLVRNFSSFQRLLNLHGFRRSSPSMRDTYFHPLFLESQRDLVKNIVRIALPTSIEGDSAGAHAGR